jgi:3-phenylpropionate/trans-cinnamate dioxygenase ferredoxin subunit
VSTTRAHTRRNDDLDKKYVVARVEDIPEGSRLIVNVQGREIGIFNVDGTFHAILNRCPHRGGALCKGDVLNLVIADKPGEVRLDTTTTFIVCPWHGWEYDIETGQSWYDPDDPSKDQRRYPTARQFGVQIESGAAVAKNIDAGTAAIENEDAAYVDPKTHRLKGPYTAEMFPVDIENNYIVITLRRLVP